MSRCIIAWLWRYSNPKSSWFVYVRITWVNQFKDVSILNISGDPIGFSVATYRFRKGSKFFQQRRYRSTRNKFKQDVQSFIFSHRTQISLRTKMNAWVRNKQKPSGSTILSVFQDDKTIAVLLTTIFGWERFLRSFTSSSSSWIWAFCAPK